LENVLKHTLVNAFAVVRLPKIQEFLNTTKEDIKHVSRLKHDFAG